MECSFASLPYELRKPIWILSFVPRRLLFKRPSSRPLPSIRSSVALLHVNQEARKIFLEHYEMSMEENHSRGIYINFAIDTIVPMAGYRQLLAMMDTNREAMTRVQYLDLTPSLIPETHPWTDFSGSNPFPMRSLKLVTIRWPLNTQCPRRLADMERNPWNIDYENILEKMYISLMYLFVALKELYLVPPTVVILLDPEEVHCDILSILTCSWWRPGIRRVSLKQVSSPILDRLEETLSDRWREIWPGRDKLESSGWVALEVEEPEDCF